MVNNKYIRGIFFVSLIIGVVLTSIMLIVNMAASASNENITVSITSPTDGQTISGNFQFNATVTDTNDNVNAVYFTISNSSGIVLGPTNVFTGSPAPTSPTGRNFNFPLDTTTLANFNYTLTVNATNENLNTAIATRNFTVYNAPPPATYTTGNRIWDGAKCPSDFSKTYTWNPQSFSGFYYDVNSNVGNESITIALNGCNDRNIDQNNIVYDTTPQEVEFGYSGFGSYQVIGFMADKYFAGYTVNSTPPNPTTNVVPVSTLGQGQLHKVLIDDDTKRTISVGGTLTLQEGYVLKATDISTTDRIMLISLLKDGNVVDQATLQQNQTYGKRVVE